MTNFLNLLKNAYFFIALLFAINAYSKDNIKYGVNFGGLIQYDYVHWIGDVNDDFISGLFIKEISFFIDGNFTNNVNFFTKFDLSNYKLKNNLSQAYIKYSHDVFNFKLGQIIPNLSLEDAMNNKHKLFIENALLKCNLEENFLGASIDFNFYNYKVFLSFIIPELSNIKKKIRNKEYSLSFRGFKKMIEKNDLLIHAGFNYSVFNRGEDDILSVTTSSFKDIPSFWPSFALLRSHPSCLPKYYILGLEFMSIYKSLSIQSEIRYNNALWRDFDSELYSSFYIQLSYFLTGEKRNYDLNSGSTFILQPKNKIGSFEIAFRYNYINITNEGPLLRGVSQADGRKDAYNLGINWFISDKIRLQLNYSYEKFSYRIYSDRRISAIGLRTQFEF
ncbi:MAG TPA: porin [Candidatus Azoamicus sp. MARI]